MAQMTSEVYQNQKVVRHEFVNSIPVEIERIFHAPVDQVWKAWTDADMIMQWWGPETYSCPEAHLDFREGGQYNLAMKGPDQKITWSGGVVEEIVPQQKIVFTDRFTDEIGKPVPASTYGMTGDWPENSYITVIFERANESETKMYLLHEGIPSSLYDDCVQGWNSSLDKLQRLVEHV